MMNRKDHHIVQKIVTKFLAAWDNSNRLSERAKKFVQEMLKKTGVLFIPGWGFGNAGKNAVRISFGPLVNDIPKIEEGIIKISKTT